MGVQPVSLGEQFEHLAPGDVHVWSALLDVPPDRRARLAAHLSLDERQRAARFRAARHGERFSAARGTLRELLGAYLHRPPAGIDFVYGPTGKPALAPQLDASGLAFNLAHAGHLGLFAFARGRDVGVDLEAVRSMPDLAAVARSVMTAAEYGAFDALSAPERLPAFFALWTRKEALLKATGEGFSRPPHGFAVADLGPAGWTLRDLTLAPGFAACVAVQGTIDALVYRQWERPPA